ncbi:MAG: ornithine carbamoyltransferase [Alistipes sp.]|nr:ornithine carbamoyltransferase [Alistipes sp.]
MVDLKGKSFLKIMDFSAQEIIRLLELSANLKRDKKEGKEKETLTGKNIVLIFEKDSTRTRCSFEVAAFDQGARVTYLGPTGSQIGKKESTEDTARVLGRMYDGIEYRGYGQHIVETLAGHAGVPVWNGLTDEAHPTQVLADLLTMQEHCQKPLAQMKLCFVGDAKNNVANSLMVGAAKLGIDYTAVCPPQCAPGKRLLAKCREIAALSGAKIEVAADPAQGVAGADFIYTDVWVSMGEPDEIWQDRISLLRPYQVNRALMEASGNPDVKFLHCLPAFHNDKTKVAGDILAKFGLCEMEVTDEVFESPASVVFDQAENRMHTIKAVMVATLAGGY